MYSMCMPELGTLEPSAEATGWTSRSTFIYWTSNWTSYCCTLTFYAQTTERIEQLYACFEILLKGFHDDEQCTFCATLSAIEPEESGTKRIAIGKA